MNKSVVLILMAILFIAPTVAAIDTTITVTTHPSTWVMVRVFEAGNSLNLLQSFLDTQVGETGIISFDLSTNMTPVDVEVYIKLEKNGQSFVYKEFKDVSASEPINLQVMKGNPDTEPKSTTVATETEENATTNSTVPPVTTETVSEKTESSTAVTGNAIAGEGSSFKSYYIIVAVLVAGLIIGGLLFARKRMHSNGTLGMTSAKDVPEEKMYTSPTTSTENSSEQLSSETLDSLKAELQKTKERLQVTTSDLAKMRNQDRITKLEQNIKEEEAELRKLRDESQQD